MQCNGVFETSPSVKKYRIPNLMKSQCLPSHGILSRYTITIVLTALGTVTRFNLCLSISLCSCQMFIPAIYYDLKKLWSRVQDKICKVSNFVWLRNFTQSFFYNSKLCELHPAKLLSNLPVFGIFFVLKEMDVFKIKDVTCSLNM